ncbi:hypothetical protein AgCh_035232 [Apium graveolens]
MSKGTIGLVPMHPRYEKCPYFLSFELSQVGREDNNSADTLSRLTSAETQNLTGSIYLTKVRAHSIDKKQWTNNWYQSKLLIYKEFKDQKQFSKMNKKDVGVKIPFLDKDNYHHWKVKMHLHMLSQDETYVDCIERGPHVPIRAATGNEPSVRKPRHEWSDPDIEQVRKDKKAMNILFNGVDADMFDNIINCKTAKEVWDTIQIICDGTEQLRENKMQLLIQQYEHFHNEESESLTDIFSRF